MTGCPYRLIYSASQTFEPLIRSGRVRYLSGLLALRVSESPTSARVYARELTTDGIYEFDADRIFLAAGAIGTTRIMLNSLERYYEDIELAESAQFLLPALSGRRTPDPRNENEVTLNQFNVVVTLDGSRGLNVCQIHFYPYNPSLWAALPASLKGPGGARLAVEIIRRLSIGLGYIPSWASPKLRLRAVPGSSELDLPDIRLTGDRSPTFGNPFFRQVAARLAGAGRSLDLWPVLPMTSFSAPGKSYHWGGSFPHQRGSSSLRNCSDLLGRVGGWARVHLVDASTFPTVAATTFTLTIMANAHRIASEVLAL
jgi:hypothetical protein